MTAAGHAARQQVLARLAELPALDERQVDAWRKKIAKLWSKAPKLEKSGDNWFWAADKKHGLDRRGRYVVGGETQHPKGLLIAMHGGGAGAGDAGSAASAYGAAASKFGWLMIAPEVLEKTEHGWTDSGSEEFVLDLVDAALRTWKIDPNRVYFAGHSMGGYGSWMLGAHHADRVAAIAPSAGAPTPIMDRPGGDVTDIIEGVIPSLHSVFVSVYQSLDDPQVPPRPNQVAVGLLGKAAAKWGGFEHDYWEVNGRGHGEPPGGHVAQLAKIAERVRNPVPTRIVWQPVLPWKRQFYWLHWEQPAVNAIVVADLDRKANKITITCDKDPAGLSVLLDERVLDLGKDVTVVANGKEVFRGKVRMDLDTLLLTGDHPDPGLQFVAQAPATAKGT
jgi:pimeloyl-ACP methyl ester carboxylesterase